MQLVYGVAQSTLVSKGMPLVEFPPFLGRSVGGVLPVDCKVSVLALVDDAVHSTDFWSWAPAEHGFVIVVDAGPFSVLKNHLRGIRQMPDELGRNRIWPWFDPRYLQLALTSLEGQDLSALFGPVRAFCFASSQGAVQRYQLEAGRLAVKEASTW